MVSPRWMIRAFHAVTLGIMVRDSGSSILAFQSAKKVIGVGTESRLGLSRKRKNPNWNQDHTQEDSILNHDLFDSKDSVDSSFISSPMDGSAWKWKEIEYKTTDRTSGRGRSVKRSNLYHRLSSYHSTFLSLLTDEFRVEESQVLNRLQNSLNDPLILEISGHALFDMYPERRGDIFTDEVYRLTKAKDATSYSKSIGKLNSLPDNHKFSQSDVIVLTLQPLGSGDFMGPQSMPLSDEATILEARVLNVGPTYLDISIPGGKFEEVFGPAPNNYGPLGKGDPNMRLRVDRFFSDVSYRRMVQALSQATTISNPNSEIEASKKSKDILDEISVDEDLRQIITATFDPLSKDEVVSGDERMVQLNDLYKRISVSTLKDGKRLADEAIKILQANTDDRFPPFNEPQLSSIRAALSRKLTMIQGPPGTGKTTVAGAIAYGFVYQCRRMPYQAKVLACAFSNVGADNLVEQMLRMGLRVIRVGKASSVSPNLWNYTLDSAISKDPDASRAMQEATIASMKLRLISHSSGRKSSRNRSGAGDDAEEKRIRERATLAIKESIKASNIAATKALRQADVIVSTCIGAADSRLLAACGYTVSNDDDEDNYSVGKKRSHDKTKKSTLERSSDRGLAPDRMPPIFLPFVILDESCQCVEPSSLVPIFSSNSCQSLVMLGDPCQLPPTVLSDDSGNGSSQLSLSLMSRLAMMLPTPSSSNSRIKEETDETFLSSGATKQAKSIIKFRSRESTSILKKRYLGAYLLSIQYRMHPSISAFSSAIFYDGKLQTPLNLRHDRLFPAALDSLFQINDRTICVRFVNISGNFEIRGGKENSSESGIENFSISNEKEAVQVVSLIKNFLIQSEIGDGFSGSIGVVTPYSAQVSLLEALIASDTELLEIVGRCRCSIEINSVDAYQGRERDVIIFSAVRSNELGKVGFLSDWRRMNVALTRAKSGLIVVGDLQTLKKGDMHWDAFCSWLETLGCVYDLSDVP